METSAVQDQIKQCLVRDFKPVFVEVTNDSARHHGHLEAPSGVSGSHFRIQMASEVFSGSSLIQRHQAVYRSLENFFKTGVHALQMELLSVEEWHARRTV